MSMHELAYTKGGALVDYGREIEQEIATLQELIEQAPDLSTYPPRWLAIKLLEQDADILEKLEKLGDHAALIQASQISVEHLTTVLGDDVDVLIADRRYGYIAGLVKEAVKRPNVDRVTKSDRIDRIVTNRWLGIPIFLLAMWIVFQMTANVSAYYLDWVDGVIGGPITNWIVALLGWLGISGGWFESLMVDGIIAGVGSVLVFVPVLMFLYFFLALLEDSGYMARAAFVMDRAMHALGLHGKSFLPMLVGFGCTVPAIYATRTLENEDDRKLTGFLVPMMSCGARLPVYTIFAAAFFPENPGGLVFAMYIVGIALAVITGMVMKRTVYKNKPSSPFVMELPPYRMPTLRSIWTHMWERSAAFVRKAGTIILAVSIVLWFLMSLPWGVEDPADSYFGKASTTIAPIFAPAGFDTWQAAGSLVTGFLAKEVVISTMSQAYAIEEEAEAEEPTTFLQDVGGIVTSFGVATWDTLKATISLVPGVNLMGQAEEEAEDPALVGALQNSFTPLSAIAFNLFVLLYAPCMVAIAAFRQEFGTRYMLINTVFLTVLAYIVAVLVYQGGMLLGFV